MKELNKFKKYTLAVVFISQKCANILDDIGEIFIKLVKSRQNKARDKQTKYKLSQSKTACDLITTLKDILIAYKTEGNDDERFTAIDDAIKSHGINNTDDIINKCEIHNTFAGDNYFPFAWDCIKGKCRKTLFMMLDNVDIYSTTQDKTMEQVIRIIKKYRNSRLEKIPKEEFKDIDLSWISEKWTKLLTGHSSNVNNNEGLNRRHFEACSFYEIMQDLKSGDLCIYGNDKYSDYREQLISWEEYNQQINLYGEPILMPLKKKEEPKNLNLIKSLLADRWYDWTKFFGPLSGLDSKLEDPIERYLTTVFCYGCNLGPSQTADSLNTITRKQISYIDQ